jgi:hypothetical protein
VEKDSFRWDETMRISTSPKLPMDLATRRSGAGTHRYSNATCASPVSAHAEAMGMVARRHQEEDRRWL